jgi:glycosylphosphatidylinositol transamidase (GPIT) subunit GPI8
VQSDVAQAQAMLLIAARGGAQRVALLCPDDPYGATFFDWVGFLGTEAGLEVTGLVQYAPGTDPSAAVAEALAGNPQALLLVPAGPEDAVTLVRLVRQASPLTALILSDMGAVPALVEQLGDLAEGLEGTAPAPDPASGFEVAFKVLYGKLPPPYAANVYDALTLVAFGLEASGGRGGEALERGLEAVVDGRGAPTRWDFDGVAKALAAIDDGEHPDLVGASGSLDFDRELYTDPVETFYSRWRVDHGRFVQVETLTTGDTGRALSLDSSRASEQLLQEVGGGTFQPGPRTGTWALVAALSSGWPNYRHQADALAQYQLLRANGLPDDRIILVLEDDLADNPMNAEPGVVRNVAGGPNVRAGAVVDYRTGDLGAGDLLAILAGQASERLPAVIGSGTGDDLYVFLVGHGDTDGALVETEVAGDGTLTPEALAQTVQAMFDQGRYRRLLIAVETCHGGVLGTLLTAPGAVLLSGANPVESSFGANYDLDLRAWLGDQFAFHLVEAAANAPEQPLDDLYRDLFLRVSGSHVSMYNAQGFGGAGNAVFGDFLRP